MFAWAVDHYINICRLQICARDDFIFRFVLFHFARYWCHAPREVILAAADYSTLRDRQHTVQISDSSCIPARLYLKQAYVAGAWVWNMIFFSHKHIAAPFNFVLDTNIMSKGISHFPFAFINIADALSQKQYKVIGCVSHDLANLTAYLGITSEGCSVIHIVVILNAL